MLHAHPEGANRPTNCSSSPHQTRSPEPPPIGVAAYRSIAILMVFAAIGGTALWFSSVYSQSVERRRLAQRQMSGMVTLACKAARREAIFHASSIAHNTQIARALATGSALDVPKAVLPLLTSPEFDHFTVAVCDLTGKCIWSSHPQTQQHPMTVALEAIKRSSPFVAVSLANGSTQLNAAAPVLSSDRRAVGAVVVSRQLEELVPSLSHALHVPVAYLLFDPAPGPSQPQTDPHSQWTGNVFSVAFPKPLARALVGRRSLPETMWAAGRIYVMASHPLISFDDRQIGLVVTAQDITIPELKAWSSFVLSLFGALLLLACLAVVMWQKSKYLSSRTDGITQMLDEFVRGEMPQQMPQPPTHECATHLQRLEMLRKELQRRQDRIQQMWRCQDLMSHARDERELCEIAWHYANKAGVELLEVFRIDNSRAHVRRIARFQTSLPEAEQRWHTPAQCRAYRKGATYTVADPADMGCSVCPSPEEGAYMCMPLISNGLMVVLMRCGWCSPSLPDEDTQRTISSYANLLAVSLDNVYLVEQLREATLRDPLTGLYNRRFLEEYLLKLSAQLQRDRRDVAVLMIDFDHFKAVNDDYGHEAGDAVLRSCASVIARSVREGDVVCRYGGEEIVAVLPNCQPTAALDVAERVRKAVAAQAVHLPDRVDPVRVTVSIGLACYPTHATLLLDLLELADKALYEAKQAGRNRCVMWQEADQAPAAA